MRDWYVDYSCISNTYIDYSLGKVFFDYITPFTKEHPISRKLSIANHFFISLEPEPQIIRRTLKKLDGDNIIKQNNLSFINDAIQNHIKTFRWD